MRHIFKALVLVAFMAFVGQVMVAFAQGGPSDQAYDRIFQDISQRIGRTVSRVRFDGAWTWEELRVTDNNLGCANGAQNAPGQTRAYKVVVIIDGTGTYEYRVSIDSQIVFLCTAVGVGAPTPVAPGQPTLPAVVAPPPVFPEQPAPITQPTAFQAPVVAYIALDGNVYITQLGSNRGGVPITGDAQGGMSTQSVYYDAKRFYSSLKWSPDGSKLLFRGDDRLYVVNSGQAPLQVASGLASQVPASWSPDGSEIAYVVDTGQPAGQNTPDTILQIQAVPATGGQPRVVGQITFGYGCGGGGFPPSVILRDRAIGYNGSQVVFHWTARGFIHTLGCTGTGLALTGLDGTRVWEQRELFRVEVAPDATRAVAVRYNPQTNGASDVLLIDLTSGQVSTVLATPSIGYVGWNGNGTQIVLTIPILKQMVQGNPNLTQPPLVAWPTNADLYTITVYVLPATGGEPFPLFSADGYAIGNLSSSTVTDLVAFTLIESDAALIQHINAGARPDIAAAAAPRTRIGAAALPPGQGGYLLAGNASQPALGRGAQFLAIPAQLLPFVSSVVPSGDNPLGLVIGGRAVVPAGDNVNMRTGPTTVGSNVVGIIRPGDFVVILAGPTVNDGLRWWQVRREADGVIGWVADIDRTGVPNLTPVR